MRRKLFGMFCLGMGAAALPLYLVACGVFPTTTDVNTLTKADHKYVAGEHQATRDQMTEEHGIQTPDLVVALMQVNADAAAAVKELRERVDAVEAKGVDIGSLGGANGLAAALLGLLGLGTVGTVVSRKQNALELKLATAAKAGAAVPSDSPGLPPT